MTNEQLVQEIQSGNNTKENLATLYQQNKPFIRKVAKAFSRNEYDLDDLMQECYFAIEKAAYSYDVCAEASFLTYASYKLWSCCNRHVKKNYVVYVHSLEENIGSDEEALTIGETLCSELNHEEQCLQDDLNKRIWERVEKLDNPRLISIVEGIYKDGKSQQQIAGEMEISGARVQQLQRRAFGILKKTVEIQEAAEYYGYACYSAYNYTLSQYKNTMTSGVEHIVLKHLELEERMKKCDDVFNEIMNVV